MKSPGILLDPCNNCNYFTKLDMKKVEHSLDQFKRLFQKCSLFFTGAVNLILSRWKELAQPTLYNHRKNYLLPLSALFEASGLASEPVNQNR